jgi:hypothetical protein
MQICFLNTSEQHSKQAQLAFYISLATALPTNSSHNPFDSHQLDILDWTIINNRRITRNISAVSPLQLLIHKPSIMPFVLEDYNDTMSAPQHKSQDRRSSANGLPSPTTTHGSDNCQKDDARRASPQPENRAETRAQSLNSTNGDEPEYYDYDEEDEYEDEE